MVEKTKTQVAKKINEGIDDYDFDTYFPTVADQVANLEANTDFKQIYRQMNDKYTSKDDYSRLSDEFYMVKMKTLLNIVHQECITQIGPVWNDLLEQNDGFVAVHTILVLWRAVNDPIYLQMT